MSTFVTQGISSLASAVPERPAASQRRAHRRVPLNVPLRFRLPDGKIRDGVMTNLSVRGAYVVARPGAISGDRVSMVVPGLGPLTGRVVRVTPRGFAVVLGGTRTDRVRRADALTVFLNTPKNETRAVRYPTVQETTIETVTGQIAPCVVLDVSASGAQIATELFPALGENVRVGSKQAVVVRHFDDGIGIAFRSPRPAA